MNQKIDATRLIECMNEQLVLIKAYINYLNDIKQTIISNDPHALNDLLLQNQPHIDQIEGIQAKQSAILLSFGVSNDENGINTCIKSSIQHERLSIIKETLHQQLSKLEKALLVNDLLVRKNQDRIKHSIRILSGHQSAPKQNTYSRMGSTHTQDEKQTIAMA